MAVTAGDVVVLPLRQATGSNLKPRPALVLATLPGAFQSVLIAGISSDLSDLLADWDDTFLSSDADFALTGLLVPSAIRLSYLYAAETELTGRIGEVTPERLERMCGRLAGLLARKVS